jgi:HPt (histidine-containing phosphotransfer) domain-containing protein
MVDCTADSEIFDQEGFLTRMMGDRKLAEDIMKEYLTDMNEQLRKLKVECNESELETLHRLAHTVKGASANVGATKVQKTAFLAEQAAVAGDRTEYIRLVSEIDAGFSELKSVLTAIGYLDGAV